MKPVRAAILVRISDDRAGDAAGVGRQEKDARALAERLGWQVGEVIIENDVSAYK
ncbi:MAG: recombinase family protein, partial [Actinomycetota bacterium]|nr:recombinase family protein [Actinomycetota bacterium]